MSKEVKTFNDLKDSSLLYDKNIPCFGYMIIIVVAILVAAVVIWSIKTPKVYMITSAGMVQSSNKNYVMSPVTGEITSINIKEGKNVEKGDTLFTVKSTEYDLQDEQIKNQQGIYETQIEQYEKLVKSIKDNTNYFDASKSADNLYYSQYEAYKSQVNQNKIDASQFKVYGYTNDQIKSELVKNQSKITEIYYSAIKSAEDSMQQSKAQLDSLNAQLKAVKKGQSEYKVTANADGKIHMMSDFKDGMVLQTTSTVASIASEKDKYEIDAFVSLSDAARVKVGNHVDIAVSGLTQSVYGTISGTVTQKDSDATTTTSQNGSENGQTSFLKIKIKPDYNYLISKSGDKVNITNGMAVEARIQYDKISYFDYVMDSLGILNR